MPKLTNRLIDAMVYEGDGKSRDVRWDSTLPGFGIRIYPTGRKAFVISYRALGRKRLMTLDTYGVITQNQARKRAARYLVTKDDEDPLEKRKRETHGETVSDLCDTYMERHAKLHKKTWQTDQRRINRHIKPALGALKVRSATDTDIGSLHRKIGTKAPYEANRVIELLSKMFSLACDWGFLPEHHRNPARKIKRFKEEKRDRFVDAAELPKLAQAIDQEKNQYIRGALWLYLLTGVRRSELLKAKWDDVNWGRRELRLADTKAGRVHYVPLNAPAIAVLETLPRLSDNPYVLPGSKEGRHLVNIDRPWIRAKTQATILQWMEIPTIAKLITEIQDGSDTSPSLEAIQKKVKEATPPIELTTGLLDVRLHDLRRTVGSWLAQSGNSLHLIGKVLNHSNQATTAVYARFAQDQVRAALEQHGNRIMGAAKQKKAELLELKSAKVSNQ